MAGVASLIDSDNVDTGTYDKTNVRDWLSTLKRRGAFLGNTGVLMVNDEGLKDLYSFDDSNVGISWRDTDRFLGEVRILGIAFTVFCEPMMNRLWRADKARMFAFTPKVKGKSTLRLALKARARAVGMPRQVLATQTQYELDIARFASMELLDPFRHGLYKET